MHLHPVNFGAEPSQQPWQTTLLLVALLVAGPMQHLSASGFNPSVLSWSEYGNLLAILLVWHSRRPQVVVLVDGKA